jgi:hypothetical protein
MRGNLYSKVRTDTTWSMQRLKSRHVCGRCRERPVALYLDSSFFTGSRQHASKSAVSATCSRCSNCGKIRSVDVLANELINRIINGRVCDGAQVSHLLDCPGKMVDRSPTPPEFPIDHHENMLWAFFSSPTGSSACSRDGFGSTSLSGLAALSRASSTTRVQAHSSTLRRGGWLIEQVA